jgi:solute carrier family 25 phosphate transporter 3
VYEFFKSRVPEFFDDLSAERLQIPILLAASGVAETIASFALCPLEVTKIYMIVNPDIAVKGLSHSMSTIVRQDGLRGLYKGIAWVLLRQVPYTCVKLVSYDIIHSYFVERQMQRIAANNNEQTELSPRTKIYTQLGSGVLAGLLAAIISQPADVILSRVCSHMSAIDSCLAIDSPKDLFQYVTQDLGWKGSFAGLKQRSVMVGSMTALQFVVFENSKQYVQKVLESRRRNGSLDAVEVV